MNNIKFKITSPLYKDSSTSLERTFSDANQASIEAIARNSLEELRRENTPQEWRQCVSTFEQIYRDQIPEEIIQRLIREIETTPLQETSIARDFRKMCSKKSLHSLCLQIFQELCDGSCSESDWISLRSKAMKFFKKHWKIWEKDLVRIILQVWEKDLFSSKIPLKTNVWTKEESKQLLQAVENFNQKAQNAQSCFYRNPWDPYDVNCVNKIKHLFPYKTAKQITFHWKDLLSPDIYSFVILPEDVWDLVQLIRENDNDFDKVSSLFVKVVDGKRKYYPPHIIKKYLASNIKKECFHKNKSERKPEGYEDISVSPWETLWEKELSHLLNESDSEEDFIALIESIDPPKECDQSSLDL